MLRILLAVLIACSPTWAVAGTVIASTVTYSGADVANFPGTALPEPGTYAFTLNVVSTPSATSAITAFIGYVQQQYVSGGDWLTVSGSTFTTCTLSGGGSCTYTLWPALYHGGNLRAAWSVTSGSATVKVTAHKVNP